MEGFFFCIKGDAGAKGSICGAEKVTSASLWLLSRDHCVPRARSSLDAALPSSTCPGPQASVPDACLSLGCCDPGQREEEVGARRDLASTVLLSQAVAKAHVKGSQQCGEAELKRSTKRFCIFLQSSELLLFHIYCVHRLL